MVQAAEEWLTMLPPVTRAYLILAVLTTAGCSVEVINQIQIYFNLQQIIQGQVWRILTCFCFFGNFGMEFVFQMFLLVRYCRSLEENSFRSRSADFLWLLLTGGVMMLAAAPFLHLLFLGESLSFMVVYVWSRRNQHVRLSLFGVVTFTAPYFPWVLIGFSLILGASPKADLLGVAAGHVYYYFEEVYPRMSNGFRLLATPVWLKAMFGENAPAELSDADTLVEPANGELEPGNGELDWQREGAGQGQGDGQHGQGDQTAPDMDTAVDAPAGNVDSSEPEGLVRRNRAEPVVPAAQGGGI